MKTFQGETLESLIAQLNYVNTALSHDLEKWERKEYEQVKNEIEQKLKHFDN